MTVAVVPFKNSRNAKQRLARILSEKERRDLAHAMLKDVLSALSRSSHIDQVFVVAENEEPGRTAKHYGAGLIPEPKNRGYNEAVATAVEFLTNIGTKAMLVVPADVPLVSHSELEALARPTNGPVVRMVPSRDGDGTNGLFLSPPDGIATRFGSESAKAHHQAARERALAYENIELTGLGFDIDTPEDLTDFRASGSKTHSASLLRKWQLPLRASSVE